MLLLVLIGIGAFVWFWMQRSARGANLKMAMQNEIIELEGDLATLEALNLGHEMMHQRDEGLLVQKHEEMEALGHKLGQMEDRIRELEKQRGVDQALIKQMRAKLQQAQTTLAETYRKEMDYLFQDNHRLIVEQDSLEAHIAYLDSLCQGPPPPDLAWLRAEQISFEADNSRRAKTPGVFRSRQTDSLKLSFQLVAEGAVPNTPKTVFMVCENPRGQILTYPQTGNSWFNFKGKQHPFSRKNSINYQGKPLSMNFWVNPEEGSFEPGTYQIKLYCENELIGQAPVQFD